MTAEEQLFEELVQTRNYFKTRTRYENGRASPVCSDEAIIKIFKLKPRKIEDFESIDGIGKTFIENYGETFLKVIDKYVRRNEKQKVELNDTVSARLKELQKRLVNINRRNRLLYMPRIVKKYAFDLFDPSQKDILKTVFSNRKKIAVFKINEDSREPEQYNDSKYRHLISLLREVNNDLREKGQNNLYIGYPFIIGRLPGEEFNVRAPLALFPVTADKGVKGISIFFDESRDVLYNNTLVLAFFKFNGINKPLPENTVEDREPAAFLDSLISFYKENGIEIKNDNENLREFKNYKSEEFPRFRSGELYIENCIVLGKFPMYSNSIQKDFDEILNSKEINILLNDLLSNYQDPDYSGGYSGEDEIKDGDHTFKISESDLTYINELNSSQEQVLSALKNTDGLVVHGPPGTGKSQTITSLITDFAYNDKTVLLVSEKKTALDVVYSRLGELSKYAVLIDDVNNKDLFYKQLSKIMDRESDIPEDQSDPYALSEEIDSYIKRFEDIASLLYAPGPLGIEPYKLYSECKKEDHSPERLKAFDQFIDERLYSCSYETLKNIRNLFDNETLVANLDKYISITTEYSWLRNIKSDTDEDGIRLLEYDLNVLMNNIRDWSKKGFFNRLLGKCKIRKEIKSILSRYFSSFNRTFVTRCFKKTDCICEGIRHYLFFKSLELTYKRLKEDELAYLLVLLNLKNYCENSYIKTNDFLFNQVLRKHISRFEADNRALFQNIEDFSEITLNIDAAIAKKRQLVKKRLKRKLADNIFNIDSKRYKEILRLIESKRKWSVSKFIRKFNFDLSVSLKIWLLTPEVVSEIIPLQIGFFDLVVFDEASQMFVEKGLPSILRAKKAVVAGDQKQLRPSSIGFGRTDGDDEDMADDAETSAALEQESLLDLARYRYDGILLKFHYRSEYEELIAFSNYAFYSGRLRVSPNAGSLDESPIKIHKIDHAAWIDRSNIKEAEHVVKLLKTFFSERTTADTVGIITFNSNQRDLIEDLIDEECKKDPAFNAAIKTESERRYNGEDIGLFIKNIENVQGDERDVIIFSIGYAKNEQGRMIRNYGWLNQRGGENRLNVAISRAKKRVHIVVSFHPSELYVDDMKNDGPRILKKYLEYAFAVSDGNKNEAQRILLSFGDDDRKNNTVTFDSDFENQVYDALVEKGYEVDTQVGIGGYHIDLAVKKNDKYVLGIECDGKLYHSSKSARERDYYRQKYLESRGWTIYRIWSPKWWKNPQGEIFNIRSIVDSMR